jgi:fructokinase
MKDINVIGLGEVLWDVLPDGKELGGAPANFAYHVNNLGVKSTVISAIGNDDLGNEIKEILNSKNIDYELNISANPTGTVSVKLHNGIPDYIIHENVAWDDLALNDSAKAKLRKADAICFGSLAQRSQKSRQAIYEAIGLAPKKSIKVFDINLRQNFYSKDLIGDSIKLANILKLNTEELCILQEYYNLDTNQEKACNQLIEHFNLQLVALTNGSKNSILFTKDAMSMIPTPRIKVVDTVGAGDSFTAAMVTSLLKGESLKNMHRKAVDYSARVCMKKGATPTIMF